MDQDCVRGVPGFKIETLRQAQGRHWGTRPFGLSGGLLLNSLEAETGFAQGVADGGDVGRAAGFDGDVDDGFAEADAVVGAVVHGFDDVGAFAGENLGERQQRAGTVLQINADAQQAAVFYQAALDDLGQQT